ncbi:MAG: hypothetical protein IJ746_03515 [Ruminococcus sp.]|nr:hypothetical protein [Ruminococcus sp.]MBR1764443.1 hypothetical protein [Ruminococcus sp.]
MGLFSKLLGGGAEKAAKDLFNEFWKEAGGQPVPEDGPSQPQQSAPAQQAAPAQPAPAGPSGFSWGPTMPDEENQFSFGGAYHEYFEQIYRAEFPAYQLDKRFSPNGNATVFTFTRDGRKALVVELISERSNPYKVRRDCQKEGVAYLRFYYDHHGWWNTRRYVVERTGRALG